MSSNRFVLLPALDQLAGAGPHVSLLLLIGKRLQPFWPEVSTASINTKHSSKLRCTG